MKDINNKCDMCPLNALEIVYINANDCYGEYDVVKDALEQKEKQDEAIKLIVKKQVDIVRLLYANNIDEYNFYVIAGIHKLTEDEFYLLKEVLDNE